MGKSWKKAISAGLPLALAAVFLWHGSASAQSGYLSTLNSRYGSSYSCNVCHTSVPARNAYGAAFAEAHTGTVAAALAAIEPLDSDGDSFSNLDELNAGTYPGDPSSFPVVQPACTDQDSDGYAVEGGACGPIDCNDNDPAINPGATEICTDGIDNNCNALIDIADPTAVSCPVTNPLGERFGIFRSGAWYLDSNRNGIWDSGSDTAFTSFGAPTDVPVAGDWQGNGQEQVGVYRNGAWYLDTNGNGTWDAGSDTRIASFGGTLTDVPVTGDWNGNGITKVGVYRDGSWYLDTNGNGVWDAGIDTLYAGFGTPTDIPVTGDWNGNGTTKIGVYRDGVWYLDSNGNGVWDAGVDTVATFGQPNDIPVTGDWNGDGTTQIGVYRDGTWYLDTNGNGVWDAGTDMVYATFGGNLNDIPVTLK